MKLRSVGIVIVALVVIGGAAYFYLNRTDHTDGTAPALAGAPASADPVARGAYLAKASDCIACHTVVDSGRDFAGGLPFKLPFGTIYSSNITADKETGIGNWSDDDFVRAVREGVRQDGKRLYPAFPYTAYTAMSRADVLAIKAYLFSLPPIRQETPKNDLSFPFNQRWAMGFWNAISFKSQRFVADSAKPAAWNSGKYLFALGHCAECHTPRNFAFGLMHGSELAGSEQEGWKAYNISSDPRFGIGAWSEQDLNTYLRTGHADGRGSASGPMAEVINYSMQHLAPEDTAALVSYLRSVPPQSGHIEVDAKPPAALAASNVAPAATASEGDRGHVLFAGACASCHQWNGIGQETRYASLLGTRGVNDPSGTNVSQIILQGSKLHIGQAAVEMPSFGKGYSDAEIAALTNFVVHQYGNKQGTVTAEEIARRRTP
jgi:mono/diheme cytochrome c family protein